MAEAVDPDQTVRNDEVEGPVPGTTSQVLRNMWEAVEKAVEAIMRKNDGHNRAKVAEFAAEKAIEIAKAAAHSKAKQIIDEEEEKCQKEKAEGDEQAKEEIRRPDEELSNNLARVSLKKYGNTSLGNIAEDGNETSATARQPKITHPWRKLNTLGKGAFGVVYLGVDNTGMRFAAKEVHMNGKLEKTLKDEIKILARLSHENIVRCFGHDSAGDKVYMFMELMQGSVKDKMDEDNEPISTKTAQKYTRQMMKGLIYLHQNGVVHRDIKCANVLRSDKDTVKLADMGVSKVHTHITQSIQAERAGSYHWMSPEVMGAQEGGRRSDVWSVGCTVYEMIKQKPPFAEIQGLIVLYELHQKTSQMEHRALVISDKEMDHTLKEFLLTIFVKKDQRPLADHLAEHLWLR